MSLGGIGLHSVLPARLSEPRVGDVQIDLSHISVSTRPTTEIVPFQLLAVIVALVNTLYSLPSPIHLFPRPRYILHGIPSRSLHLLLFPPFFVLFMSQLGFHVSGHLDLTFSLY